MTSTVHERLWPRYAGPDDLAAVEQVPLARRGLPESTYALLLRAVAEHADRPAVTLLPSGARWDEPTTWTFRELGDHVHRTAHVLADLGVGRTDAVALLSPNTGAVLATTLAAEAVGIAAPINPGLAADRVAALLRATGARVLVAAGPELSLPVWGLACSLATAGAVDVLLAVRPDGVAGPSPTLPAITGVRVEHLDDLTTVAPTVELHPGQRPDLDDVAGYFHTGGTTGTPKVAVHTHGNEVAMAWSLAACSTIDRDGVMLAALPLFHVNALLVTGLAPLMRGQHVVWTGPLGYRDPDLYGVFWRLVERYRVAAMSAVPTVYAVLSHVPVDADISSLTVPVVGAAPLPEAVRTSFADRTGLQLCEGYGMTEATCATARSFPDAPVRGSVGQRLPYQQVRAVSVDERTGAWTTLDPGAVGLLVVAGPTVFPGYLRDTPDGPRPDPTGVVRDGWLDTGDLGSVDADGFLRLAGRAKDLIIRGGHNIDPAAIEDALLTHPDVTAAAAVGQPDAHSGEVPVAYVTLIAGAAVTPDELVSWARTRVPERAAAPQHVRVVEAIPQTAVGKVFKPELRADAIREAVLATLGPAARVHVEPEHRTTVVDQPEDPGAAAAALDALGITWLWATTDAPAA